MQNKVTEIRGFFLPFPTLLSTYRLAQDPLVTVPLKIPGGATVCMYVCIFGILPWYGLYGPSQSEVVKCWIMASKHSGSWRSQNTAEVVSYFGSWDHNTVDPL